MERYGKTFPSVFVSFVFILRKYYTNYDKRFQLIHVMFVISFFQLSVNCSTLKMQRICGFSNNRMCLTCFNVLRH
jgi:hypothetical protein